ncbi:MAG: DUF3606 domain-containing protein [Bacteroidia bacterium]
MDNLNYNGPRDRNRISLNEDWEVKWWTKTFAVSSTELQEIISKVGNSVARVREYLKRIRR